MYVNASNNLLLGVRKMNEKQEMNNNSKTSLFTVKKVMRVLSLLCIIFVFCPSFLVSCSGQTIDVGVMSAVSGISMYGEQIVEPHFIMIVCLFIPIAILAILFLKKFAERKAAGVIAGLAAADFIIWVVFRATVKKMAEKNYCDFETTVWYVLNAIMLIAVILLAILIWSGKIKMDTDLILSLSSSGSKETLKQMSAVVNQISNKVTELAGDAAINVSKTKKTNVDSIGFCSKCGSAIAYGCRFCTSCGFEVPKSMIEAEEARRTEEKVKKNSELDVKVDEVGFDSSCTMSGDMNGLDGE